MNLTKTRTVMLATAVLVLLAAGLIVWQIARSPSTAPGRMTASTHISSTSGPVTPAETPAAPAAARITEASSAASAAMVRAAAPSAAAVPAKSAETAPPAAATGANATIKHRIAPSTAAQPPILPNEVDAAVAKALGGKKSLLRWFYLDPLARRLVASVDGLGNKDAPSELWLLRPASGEIKLAKSGQQPDTQLIKRANSQRYARFVQWIAHTDNAKLLALYARMYPLLQQTYVDLGHPEGYFNDRVIAVIDLMLATPNAKPPLRVQPASAAKLPAKASATGLQRARYEFSDPALESLATGQKLLLRMGTQNAALLKLKLKALRSGLIKLGQEPKKG